MQHRLKIDEEYFSAVIRGKKKFEIRFNDRGYKIGDAIILQEIDDDGLFTGRKITGIITYITNYKQKDGYIVFGFEITL
mgnify:CR=1 FL=1